MASRRKLQPVTSNSLLETSPHFFKVILPINLAEKKLEIPARFIKKFGNELSAVVRLQVPNGRVWQVTLTKNGKKFWFQDGWHDFVQYHSISAGYFLVFEYAKNSTFQVIIFDTTACEIQYPCTAEEEPENHEQNRMKINPKCNVNNSKFKPQNKKPKMVEMAAINKSNYENEYKFSSLLEEMGIYISEKYRLLSKEERQRAIDIARVLKPRYPSFMIVFRSVCERRVSVPAKFVNRYLNGNGRLIRLRVSDGRELHVKICKFSCGGFRLTKGWTRFSKEKNLKDGDICIFELIRMKDFILKLSVYHAALRRAEHIMSNTMAETPSHFFKVILPSTLEDKKLTIPEKFVRKFGDELSAVATLTVPNGHVWKVGLIKDGRKIWFHDGWHDFVVYHSIRAGHFLVFKYRKNSDFSILIFDMSACEVHYTLRELANNDPKKSLLQDEMESEDSPTPNLSFYPLRNKVLHECSSKSRSSEMYTLSIENQAKPSFGSALGINKSWKFATTFDSSKLEHGHEVQIKKRKVEEMFVMNELSQRKLNGNGMYNSRGSLHCRRHQSKNVENLAPSPLVQDMHKIDMTIFKTTKHKREDEHQEEVVGNETEPKDAAYIVGSHSSDGVNKITKFEEDKLLTMLEDMGISFARKYGYVTPERSERAISIAKYLRPKNPSFMMILRSSTIISCYVYVPRKFANTYLKEVSKSFKLQCCDGNEWPAELTWYGRRCFISKGWAEFSNDKNLKEGDICICELIRMKEVLLKVSVFRASNSIE